MRGWLVNDKLVSIPGTRTFWNHLLDAIPGLEDRCTGRYEGLAERIESDASAEPPDYIIRNAAYFRAMNVEATQISLVQDIIGAQHPQYARIMVADVCKGSACAVFNSEYTRAAYQEVSYDRCAIIPVGTDEKLFAPKPPDPSIPHDAVLWVGSGHDVKGFDLACYLASTSDRPWVFVMKDDTNVPDAAMVFHKIPQEQLASIASSCAVGVCTSREETQHLAGIEMGMCGTPMVATEVGVYHGREPGAWGSTVKDDWHKSIEAASVLDRYAVRSYWIDNGFTMESCMQAWQSLVASLEAVHVHR